MPKPLSDNYLVGTQGDDTLDIRGFIGDYAVDGRGGNDTIYGGNGHDSLLGGRGNDLIHAWIDDTLINGGSGVDTASFADFSDISGAGVDARLMGGLLGLEGGALQANVLTGIENLIGSDYDDYLGGNRSVNWLDGGAGDDFLHAQGASDFLTGGTGADTFEITSVSRTVTVTDFHYNDGDKIKIEGGAEFSWVNGFRPDVDGNLQQAWIGTCDLLSGGTLEVVVLGADTSPSSGWVIG